MADVKTGGISGVVGALIGAAIVFTTVDKTESVTTATIENKLAICATDSMTPEKKAVYDRVDPKTPEKIIKDTVTIAPRPALQGFNTESGVGDYELAAILKPGKKYQLMLTEDGKVIDAAEYATKDKSWLLSVRPRAIVQGE